MTDTTLTFIETSVFVIMLALSIGVALHLHKSAKAHEQRAKDLGKQINQALNR
jgi:hypothetical protein